MGWDAIIVGARCGGSPLARFLARAGKRVLLVDAATFPSDQPLSTHFIQPFGMRVLDELGLGERVRAIAPPVQSNVTIVGDHTVRFPVAGGCSPRRIDLDQALLDGAREVGAEVRLQQRVIDVLREQGRVVGVRTEARDGTRQELRATIVVGADGRNSTIANLVGAEKYFAQEGERAAYWAYWPRPACYALPPYNGATYLQFFAKSFRLCFPTNRDQLVIAVGVPRVDVERWRADPRGSLEATIRADPFWAKLIANTEPLGKTLGLVKFECFFRRAAGPGWALVGDAGLHKDPTAGFGIADALRDARALSLAILEGGDAALERYWRQRDVDSYPFYCLAADMGSLDYANPFNDIVFGKLEKREELRLRMVEVIERRLSPLDAFRPHEAIGWLVAAVARGRFAAFGSFVRGARQTARRQRELKQLKRLLAQAQDAAKQVASVERQVA
jgi:flavin-dependent dehydrogenase